MEHHELFKTAVIHHNGKAFIVIGFLNQETVFVRPLLRKEGALRAGGEMAFPKDTLNPMPITARSLQMLGFLQDPGNRDIFGNSSIYKDPGFLLMSSRDGKIHAGNISPKEYRNPYWRVISESGRNKARSEYTVRDIHELQMALTATGNDTITKIISALIQS